jgi:sugar lactone lactonase YvrE
LVLMTGLFAPEQVCTVGATLGEGPVWVGREAALWFVDIKQHKAHRFHPATGALESRDAPHQVGWVLPSDDGAMVAGLQDGLYRFEPETGLFLPLDPVEADRPDNRLNDAATDKQGRIWFGSMDDSEREPTGRFYCFDRGRVTDTGLAPVSITNGPALSPDGRLLYHTDTLGGLISVADVHDDGTLGEARPFARITPDVGYPDGPTVDSAGNVWTGIFAGWRAHCYAPDGSLIREVRFPVANITKLAFGGDDLATVYATTAQLHLKPDALAAQPQAGDLFSFRADVPGVAVTPVRLG